MKNKKPQFLRRTWSRYSKLGKGRRKKQTWRRPTGRDNKMREKIRGYPVVVSIGYKTPRAERKKKIVISNIKDMKKMTGKKLIFLGKIGKKKKLELLKMAKEKNIEFENVNIEKFIKKNEKKKSKEIKVKEEKA